MNWNFWNFDLITEIKYYENKSESRRSLRQPVTLIWPCLFWYLVPHLLFCICRSLLVISTWHPFQLVVSVPFWSGDAQPTSVILVLCRIMHEVLYELWKYLLHESKLTFIYSEKSSDFLVRMNCFFLVKRTPLGLFNLWKHLSQSAVPIYMLVIYFSSDTEFIYSFLHLPVLSRGTYKF